MSVQSTTYGAATSFLKTIVLTDLFTHILSAVSVDQLIEVVTVDVATIVGSDVSTVGVYDDEYQLDGQLADDVPHVKPTHSLMALVLNVHGYGTGLVVEH